jgi:phosphoribosylanthranilate isomerase
MHKHWIKVCGITRAEDAIAASDLGADAVGLVFYPPSPRAVAFDAMADIVGGVSANVSVVALFVNPTAAEVNQVVDSGHIDLLQFHGSESEEFCCSFDIPYMKAFRVGFDADLQAAIAAYPSAELILLDSYDKAAPGGTGSTFNWKKAASLSDTLRSKLVLAGGLNADNIADAIAQVQPYGVDVSSGVESSPGIKDRVLINKFIEGVRSVSS